MAVILEVSFQEEGLKLINFLLRNLENDRADIYRWIKTGQIRVNSKRVQAQTKLVRADFVRLPPYAVLRQNILEQSFTDEIYSKTLLYPNDNKNFIEKIYENEHLLVLNKSAGLACQGGTGQEIDLTKILKFNYPNTNFTPAPVHRLDKQTTGLVLVGKTYQALRYLSDFMKTEEFSGKTHKEYLALACGFKGKTSLKENQKIYLINYLYQPVQAHKVQALSLKDVLSIRDTVFSKEERLSIKECIKNSNSSMKAFNDLPTQINYKNQVAKLAISQITCLKIYPEQDLYYLQIGIFTGRKHQIRVQCAMHGYPILGDPRYGGRKANNLHLHAHAIHLEPNELTEQTSFYCPAPWSVKV